MYPYLHSQDIKEWEPAALSLIYISVNKGHHHEYFGKMETFHPELWKIIQGSYLSVHRLASRGVFKTL